MVSFVTNYIQNQAMGMLATGITAAGTMAGNAVGGVGGLIENSGRSVGEGVNGSIRGVGDYINGYGDMIIASMAPNPVGNTVQRTAAARAAPAPQQPPPANQKALPSSRGVPKALPPAGGKPKALPAPPTAAANKGVSAARAAANAKYPGPKNAVSDAKTALPLNAKRSLSASPVPVGKPKPGVAATSAAPGSLAAKTQAKKQAYTPPMPVEKPKYPTGKYPSSAANKAKPAVGGAVGAVRGAGAGAAKAGGKGFDFMAATPVAAGKKIEAPKGKMEGGSFF